MPKTSGATKEKKRAQPMGGWAKHAYGADHQPANRRQRRRARQALRRGDET